MGDAANHFVLIADTHIGASMLNRSSISITREGQTLGSY
jgi:hypothetical protein